MHKSRLEAFSDGVIAILITIMVLELKVPHSVELSALEPLLPVVLSYILSFIYLGIYWNNHHHLFQVVTKVNGPILWANMHLLFWLSLMPFVTAWAGENHLSEIPVALYGFDLMMAGVAYYILTLALLSAEGKNSALAKALGQDFKGKISVLIYAVGIGISCWSASGAIALYVLVAAIWLIPDRRIERVYSRTT